MKKRKINWLKISIFLFLSIYAIYTLVIQEIEIKKYNKEKEYYMEQIAMANKRQEEYKHYTEYVKSEEYIEKIAREKLGMLLPEERVYIEYNG